MDREKALKYYSDFLENDTEQASEDVQKSWNEWYGALENYICFIQEDTFQKAFRYGYKKGFEAGKQTEGC